MKGVLIVQARLGSSRLPGKVMREIEGQTMLARVVERARRVRHVSEVIVAIPDAPCDAPLEVHCRELGVPVFRGSELDVLDRYYEAARSRDAEFCVRVTSDCPLLDPEVSSMIVARFLEAGDVDYCSNKIPQSFPRGLDTEVFRFSALERARREAAEPYERVHATPYLYRHPEIFRLLSICDEVDRADWRWTVDTPEDLDFVRTVYRRLGPGAFSWRDIIRLLEAEPQLCAANAHVRQKAIEEC